MSSKRESPAQQGKIKASQGQRCYIDDIIDDFGLDETISL